MKRQYTPFTFLSHRKRRAKTLQVKTLINRERESWGGLFYDECDRAIAVASGDWLWSDIVFLGHDPAVFWNAEIITTNFAFSDAVEETAFNEAMLRLEAAGEQRVEPFDYSHRTTIGHILTPRAEQTYSIFNGLTFNDFIAKRAQEIARDAPPAVYCGYCILPGFTFGIGLGMIVEANLLSQTLIEATIQDFLTHGERNGVSEGSLRCLPRSAIRIRLAVIALTLKTEHLRERSLNNKTAILIAARLMTALNMRKHHGSNSCRKTPPYASNETKTTTRQYGGRRLSKTSGASL